MPTNAAQVESLRWKKFPVLDDGFITLVDVMGDDQSVVQAARVSYGEGTRKVSDDRGLIRYLLRHRHTTPFEMAELKLLVRVPMDNEGPLPQADLLALYLRLFVATRGLETRDRDHPADQPDPDGS